MVLEEEGAHAHAWCACACTYIGGEGGDGYGYRHSPAAQNKNLRIAHDYFFLPSRIRGVWGWACLPRPSGNVVPSCTESLDHHVLPY
jgi:hypothetical protein